MTFPRPFEIRCTALVICLLAGLMSHVIPNAQGAPVNPDAAATVVVFNETDRDSVELARFYAEKRGIPKDQVVGLKCVKTEEVTREDYDKTIAEPLRRTFTEKGWWKLRDPDSQLGPVEWNKIHYVALIRGIPLKISAASNYPGDKFTGPPPVGTTNQAAVDSELAVMAFRARVISGVMNNLYFRSFKPIAEAQHPELLLVCRLDAPTPEIVRRMITDGLAAEQAGLAGIAYIDARGITDPGYTEGDGWLYAIANAARRRGTPVVLDNGPSLFPQSYPMTKASLYFGWYSEHLSGPFVRPDFRFARGAVAVHIHSFSAATLRDPLQHWAGPLLAAGATATLGNVYEPYLSLTPHLDVFHDRLRAGLTFAESAYMSQRVLSWMTTCVGDPLYRPFKGAGELEELPANGEWADYRRAAIAWFSAERAPGDEALRAAGKKDHSGMIMEGLGLLQLSVNDRDAAFASFELAREYYGKSEDAMRVAVHEIIQLKAAGREADARALAQKMTIADPNSPAVDLLRSMTEPPPTAAVATPAPATRESSQRSVDIRAAAREHRSMNPGDRYATLRSELVREEPLLSLPRHWTELELQAHWFAGDFGREFTTTTGERVRIVQFGVWNREAGPDFAEAAVAFGDGEPKRGCIEFDPDARDWERHGHATNPNYESVVLHVFTRTGGGESFTRTAQHRLVPQVLLDLTQLTDDVPSSLPEAKLGRCAGPLRDLPEEKAKDVLLGAAQFRLRRKAAALARTTESHGADEALFQALAATLGYKSNKLPFTLLAQRLPLRLLRKANADTLLFGVSGFLPSDLAGFDTPTRSYLRRLWEQWWPCRAEYERLKIAPDLWRMSGQRPTNHPQRRLAALAQMVQHWPKIRGLRDQCEPGAIFEYFAALKDEYWDYVFTRIRIPLAISALHTASGDFSRN